MTKFVTKFLNNESGATANEYGLVAALIAVAAVATWRSVEDSPKPAEPTESAQPAQ